MSRIVKCKKLGKELEGFEKPPWPGDIGERIMAEISVEAWKMWMEHAKMIINEYRLNLATPEAQQIIREQMEDYLFGTGNEGMAVDWVPPTDTEGGAS